MIWIVLFSTYVTLESLNYIRYLFQYKSLNDFRNVDDGDKLLTENKVLILKNDIQNHLKNVPSQVTDLFYDQTTYDKISKKILHDNMCKTFYYPHHDDLTEDHGQLIHELIESCENENNIKFSDSHVSTESLNWSENKIKSWYRPIFVTLLMKTIKLYTDYFLVRNKFVKISYPNGMNLWHRDGTVNKSTVTIFIHASIGGLVIYKDFIKKLKDTDSIILLEIPGIAFGNDIFFPPTIYSMAKLLTDHLKINKFEKINMIGHSFGCNFVSCVINRFYDDLKKNNIEINKTILIEGLVFIPRLMNIFKYFNKNSFLTAIEMIREGYISDLLSIPFFYRNLYLQFYMQRCLSFTDSVLLGMTEYEQMNNKIHILLSGNDNKVILDDVVHYLNSKEYKGIVKIFDNRRHGDFAFDNDMQNYVIDILHN
jgi:hypothetical protein